MTQTLTDDAFVRLFQERFGLAVDGWAGPEVLAKLDDLAPPTATPRHRQISAAGLDLIKRSEGLRLSAYRCPADVPTIGYGSTGPHVRMGMTITEAQAEDLLIKDLRRFEIGVSELMKGSHTLQGQFDALVSLTFNIGFGDPDHKPKPIPGLRTSTLLRKHLAGDYAGAFAEFARWNKGGGRVLTGLVTRRAAEAKLYRGS